MKKSIGFIGGGRITKILLHAFQSKNAQFSQVIVYDIKREVTENLKKIFPNIQVGDITNSASQEIVFISLHPPVIMETLEIIKDYVKDNSTVISLAPKISLNKLSSKLNHVKNIVRLIPNATSYIHEGYNPVSFLASMDTDEKHQILELLKILGNTFEVMEEKLESYAILSAMLPTYFWFQWKELMEIGNIIGLSDSECKDTIRQTTISALNLFFNSNLTAEQVIDLIPVKPIADHEAQIAEFYKGKLLPLFEKIKP